MAETRSDFLKSNTAMTRSEFKNFLHETRSSLAQSNPKRKRASSPSCSVKDLRLKRVSVDVDAKIKSDVQDDAKKTTASDVNLGIQFESHQSDIIPQEMNSDNLSTRNLQTPLYSRSKLVQNSSSVSFKRLLPYLKNLTEDESSGIKICHSYDSSSNNGKILPQDVNITSGLDEVKAAEASDELNVGNSLVTKTASDANLTMEVDVTAEQSVHIIDEVKMENPNENKLETPLCLRSKLVQNSSSVGFRRLLPYLKNLIEDESSGIKICHSSDLPSNNGKFLLQDANIIGRADAVKPTEASDEMSVCSSLVKKTGISSSLLSRLIGNQNSPSYKRLLPYLNDIAKDESSKLNTVSHCNLVKAENNTYEISHSVIPEDTVVSSVVDEKNPILKRNSSCSPEVLHKPTNEELTDGQLDGISMEFEKGNIDLRRNGTDILDVLVDYNTDIVQSASDANIPANSPVVNEKDTVLESNGTHSLKATHKPTNEGQIDEISVDDQKGMNDLTKNGTEIFEVSANYNIDVFQSTSHGANLSVDNLLVHDKDTILDRNSSYSLEVSHKPVNEELTDGHTEEISVEGQEEMNDSSINDAEALELSVNYNTAVVQSNSPDANTLKYKDGFQSTPPDADIVNKLGGKNVEGSLSDIHLGSELNAGEGRLVTPLVDSPMPKKNLSPDSCSRSKVYRNSSSFSYRRLLPYLTSLSTSFTKTERNVLDIAQIQSSIAIAENELVEKSVLSNGNSLTVEQTDTNSSRDHNSMEKHNSEDTDYSSEGNDHLCSIAELENLARNIILTSSPDFEHEMVQKLSSAPSISSDLSLDELSGGAVVTNKDPFKEVSSGKTDRNQFLAPKKGILKKNYSKVCKGKCMCLDCDLHRVNAEKAFEFSRNQMLCANEVVEGLVKEMSCLRKTMEGSAVTMVNGSESYTVLQIDQKQVKGVCQRAHKVEEHAKGYMRQMFSDLNNHCRSPGPRVTFSDIVQEKSHP